MGLRAESLGWEFSCAGTYLLQCLVEQVHLKLFKTKQYIHRCRSWRGR